MNSNEIIFFSAFLVFIIGMLAIDLGVFHKRMHVIRTREAAMWTVVWVCMSLSFYLLLLQYGHEIHGIKSIADLSQVMQEYKQPFKIDPSSLEAGIRSYNKTLSLEYLTGYIIELSLSVDNIFVIVLIFSSFRVDKRLYHRVLFWGIIGAVVFRFLFIFTGAFLISHFHWVMYVFAGFLVYTGVRMFISRNSEDIIEVEHHPVVKIASRYFKVLKSFRGSQFFHRENGKFYVTPLFLVLLIVEFTDLIFAVDSIPAIFAVTKDPYIVFFSNIFAILGLRSMFFLLLNVIDRFHYFKTGLSAILIFIGLKMFFDDYLKEVGFTTFHSLIVILVILVLSIVLSFLFPKKEKPVTKHQLPGV